MKEKELERVYFLINRISVMLHVTVTNCYIMWLGVTNQSQAHNAVIVTNHMITYHNGTL